jgi:hypothetical protein
MTSGGTAVIEMPASTAGSPAGGLDVVVARVAGDVVVVGEAVVATLVGISVVVDDDDVTASADELGGAAAGAAAIEEQAAVRSATATLDAATADDLGASRITCHRIAGGAPPGVGRRPGDHRGRLRQDPWVFSRAMTTNRRPRFRAPGWEDLRLLGSPRQPEIIQP